MGGEVTSFCYKQSTFGSKHSFDYSIKIYTKQVSFFCAKQHIWFYQRRFGHGIKINGENCLKQFFLAYNQQGFVPGTSVATHTSN